MPEPDITFGEMIEVLNICPSYYSNFIKKKSIAVPYFALKDSKIGKTLWLVVALPSFGKIRLEWIADNRLSRDIPAAAQKMVALGFEVVSLDEFRRIIRERQKEKRDVSA